MIKIKRFYQINEKYFDLVNKRNPFEHISQISQNKSIFTIDDVIFNIIDTGRKTTLEKDGKILATCLYDVLGRNIDIVSISSQVKGEGYAKILMLYLIKKYGYENIERTILTPDGEKMFAEIDKFLNFDYEKYILSKTKHINKKRLVQKLSKTKPLLSTFLDNTCNYGKDFALQTFKDEIKDNKLDDYSISKIFQISEWIDDSVEYKDVDEDLPNHIRQYLQELNY